MNNRNFLAEMLTKNQVAQTAPPTGFVAPQNVALGTQQAFVPEAVLANRQALANTLLEQSKDRNVHPIARGLAAFFGTKQSQDVNRELQKTKAAEAEALQLEKDYKRQMDEQLFGLKEREFGLSERKTSADISMQDKLFGLKQEELALAKKKLELDALQKIEENKGKLTPGQEALDKEFAKGYAEYKAQGGYADVEKSLAQLKSAQQDLQGGENLSSPRIGITPDFILAAVNPKAVDTREKIQEVAQRNLKLVLGAQFTEKEGEKLISRVYNPRLEESVNAERLDRLFKQIDLAAQVKEDASNYFEQNGTLKGWEGKIPTINDFEPTDTTKKTPSKSGFKILGAE